MGMTLEEAEREYLNAMYYPDKRRMTREEAFKTIKENLCGMCACGSQCMESCDISSCDNRDAIEALQAQDLQQTCNQLATNTIDRQAAIDAMDTWDKFGCDPNGMLFRYDEDKHYVPYVHYDDMVHVIKSLPSAQPENIRCYECKHGIHSGCGDVYICHVSPELVMEHTGDFYCGYAERRTDGVDR